MNNTTQQSNKQPTNNKVANDQQTPKHPSKEQSTNDKEETKHRSKKKLQPSTTHCMKRLLLHHDAKSSKIMVKMLIVSTKKQLEVSNLATRSFKLGNSKFQIILDYFFYLRQKNSLKKKSKTKKIIENHREKKLSKIIFLDYFLSK